MAASANPGGNNQEGTNNGNGATNNNLSVPENSVVGPTQAALRHNPGISMEWSPEEQSLLEDLLAQYGTETNIVRYAKIAMQLKDKTVRDVALRCRWMTKKENGKRRKEDNISARKNKDRKEKVTDLARSSSHVTNRSSGTPYTQSVVHMDSDDGISYRAIGGATGRLLEQNAQALDQISANFANFKIHDNISLFCQARNNILTIMNETIEKFARGKEFVSFNHAVRITVKSDEHFKLHKYLEGSITRFDFNDMPEIMKQMPPLPVKLNEELANIILPRPSLQKKS